MKIGTPLSPSATRVMLLGSGELGKEVIIALQRLGVEVIAVDRYENAPGHQVAHRAHVIDMTDGEALLNLVKKERPHLIVPEIEALNTQTLAEIESAGLAQVIPTVRAVQLTMNREGIRRLAAETLGLPTSPYKFCDTLAELQAAIDGGIGYPCIVKPTMSSSGKGQSLLRGPDDVKKAWDYAASGGHAAIAQILLDHSAYIDAESPNGTTPLMMAAMYGSPDVVKLLLAQGADRDLKNQLGMTALDFAKQGSRKDAIELLQSAVVLPAPAVNTPTKAAGRW